MRRKYYVRVWEGETTQREGTIRSGRVDAAGPTRLAERYELTRRLLSCSERRCGGKPHEGMKCIFFLPRGHTCANARAGVGLGRKQRFVRPEKYNGHRYAVLVVSTVRDFVRVRSLDISTAVATVAKRDVCSPRQPTDDQPLCPWPTALVTVKHKPITPEAEEYPE